MSSVFSITQNCLWADWNRKAKGSTNVEVANFHDYAEQQISYEHNQIFLNNMKNKDQK